MIHVTDTFDANGLVTTGVFGRIVTPSQLVPTASVGNCDYFAMRLPAGIGKGTLTVSGLGEPVMIEPRSFIDGMLYIETLTPHAFGKGDTIEIELAGSSVPVILGAPAPESLASVTIPDHISVADGATVSWQAGRGESVIDLQYESIGRSQTISCHVADTGSFTIPRDVLALVDRSSATAGLSPLRVTRRSVAQLRSLDEDLELGLSVETSVLASVRLDP